MMKAQIIKQFGNPFVFELANIPKPDAKSGRVVIKVAATSVKGFSLHVISMLLPLLKNIGREAHGKILTEMAQIADAGKLKLLIDPHQFHLKNISEAHALLESGKAQGKVVATAT